MATFHWADEETGYKANYTSVLHRRDASPSPIGAFTGHQWLDGADFSHAQDARF